MGMFLEGFMREHKRLPSEAELREYIADRIMRQDNNYYVPFRKKEFLAEQKIKFEKYLKDGR